LGAEERLLVERLAIDLSAENAGPRADLFSLVHRLDDSQVKKLLDVARVMGEPIEEVINPSSELLKSAFVSEFRARLQAHHATHTTPLDRLGFENAFMSASRASGLDTAEAPSRTTRFYDVTVAGERFALKTEGSKAMKKDRLHISKLSEAAWIQDMRSARKRHDKTMEFIEEFLGAVDRIFMLRFYRASLTPHYELVEIPVSHFERVRDLAVSDFDSDAPRIRIPGKGADLLEFQLDRSDSKITIGKIDKAQCVVHAEWTLPQIEESI